MFENQVLWRFLQASVLTAWIVLLLLMASGQGSHWLPLVALALLAAHVMELPMALPLRKHYPIALPVLVAMTVIFGFTWWLPLRGRRPS
jgi:hypothetical protein